MAKRASFEESAQTKTGNGEDKAGSAPQGGDMVKIGVIVLALLGAGSGVLWYMGVFDSSPPPVPAEEQLGAEEFQKAAEENKKIQEQMQKIHKSPSGS